MINRDVLAILEKPLSHDYNYDAKWHEVYNFLVQYPTAISVDLVDHLMWSQSFNYETGRLKCLFGLLHNCFDYSVYKHDVLEGIFRKYTQMAYICEEKDRLEKKEKRYTYIPASRESFFRQIKMIHDFTKFESFLDVGCGIADKPLIVCNTIPGVRVAGIEYNKITYKIAESYFYNIMIVPQKNCLFNEDAFKFNLYNEFDLIYLYVPINNQVKMMELYEYIFSKMRPGTWLFEFAYIAHSFLERFDLGQDHTHQPIIQKVNNSTINVADIGRNSKTGKKEYVPYGGRSFGRIIDI